MNFKLEAQRILYNCSNNTHNYNEDTQEFIMNSQRYFEYCFMNPKESFTYIPDQLITIYDMILSLHNKSQEFIKSITFMDPISQFGREKLKELFGIESPNVNKKYKPLKDFIIEITPRMYNLQYIMYMRELAMFRHERKNIENEIGF